MGGLKGCVCFSQAGLPTSHGTPACWKHLAQEPGQAQGSEELTLIHSSMVGLSWPVSFNFYAEYIMQSAALDEAQAGIKIAGRNISNLIYADDTTLWQKVKKD